MKKIYFWSILILFILALLPAGLWAQNDTQRSASDSQHEPNTHVTATHAMDVGYAFMRTGNGSRSGGTQSGNVRKQAMQLVYTGRATDTLTRATTDCYYVFALQPKGFVIVAADNRVEPILGYSYDNNFVVENMPEHIKGWLNDYEKQIEVVTKSDRPAEASIQTKWNSLESGQPISNTRNDITVGPLLTTTWDQGQYYNTYCPADASGVGGHVYTGCVATAMAQIINYWQYPIHGRGTHSYNCNYGNQEINFASAQYDYTNMPDALNSNSTAEQVNAVATLMYHCGVAVNMDYGITESSSYDVEARAALINYFRFSPNLSYVQKANFSSAQWNSLLQENLAANRPLMYSGQGESGGHSFVCDGYNSDNYYHFNFGWSGNADGWYLTSAINPGSYEYNSNQTALVNIFPDNNGNVILGQTAGFSTFTVDESLEFYHLFGHNAYTGTNYTNSCNNTVVFFSADTTKKLLLDVLSFENQNVIVYDSILGNQLATLSSTTNNYSVVSTTPALTLVYQGHLYYPGFQLNISQDNGCRMVSNVTWSVDTTTIHLSWHENGNASQWQVEYGLKGFNHGDGTMLTSYDTAMDISGLASFKEYDIYVRSACGSDQYGPWRMVTVMPEAKYWTDVVTSQPEGYMEDSLGNITISSVEGFAWFSKLSQTNDFEDRHISLVADINLSQYKWMPIRLFSGVFDGHGHRIDSMYVIEWDGRQLALFLALSEESVTIKNVNLINCYSKSNLPKVDGFTGGVAAGLLYNAYKLNMDTIMNCFVSGKIVADNPAPIVYNAQGSYIINCVTNCDVIGGESGIGGIAGDSGNGGGLPCMIRNCYSASTIHSSIRWKSYIIGLSGYVENCYGFRARNGGMPIAEQSSTRDCTWFNETDSTFYLLQPIFFEPDSQYYSNLKDALNAGVRKYNLEGLRLWVDDTMGINEGMPILGPEYIVTCPNITNLSAYNIMDDMENVGLVLSWDEMGDATTWEIKYHVQDSTNEVRLHTTNNPDTIWGLTEHSTYMFSIRPVCSSINRGGWSEEIAHVFDRLYWTEIVTTQPDGYLMDEAGNVTISSAEGLAWLISTVNGLNGQTANSFEDKRVTLTQDVNIGQYKWKAINNFLGSFDGGEHTIKNLYIYELVNHQGMFGIASGGSYKNIYMDSAYVKGANGVGMLIGATYLVDDNITNERTPNSPIIVNCHVSGSVHGGNMVGGIAGSVYCEKISGCSSSGTIQARWSSCGGLFGYVYLFDNGIIRNCYSRCDVIGGTYTTGGLIGTTNSSVENCYATGNVTGGINTGGMIGSSRYTTRNCYAGGRTIGVGYLGINYIFGFRTGTFVGCSPMTGLVISGRISNCYALADNNNPFVGMSDEGTYPFVSDTASLTIADSGIVLMNSVAVGTSYYDDLLEVLNAWVDTYDTAGMFLHWVADTTGENGGFPMFEEIKYNTVTLHIADSTPYGRVRGDGTYSNVETPIISAKPDYGYYFVQWSDGNTDNPRNIRLTQDTVFTAIFGKNLYNIVGTGDTSANYNFDFEDVSSDNQWTLLNKNYINRWYIALLEDTIRALFISRDKGLSNIYDQWSTSCVYAYTTLALIPGEYNYSFDWECHGYSHDWINMNVALLPATEDLIDDEWSNNSLPSNAIPLRQDSWRQLNWRNSSDVIQINNAGDYKLVIQWYNDGTVHAGGIMAAAIDNIRISNIVSEENIHGYVLGSEVAQYLDTVILTAIPYEGCQFVQWHDGNTDNPRVVVADADKYYIAMFEYIPRTLTLNVANDTPYGTVYGGGVYRDPDSVNISISAIPDYGYHFVQWNDGNADNPRVITLSRDTIFTAIFGKNMYGIVGIGENDNNHGYVWGSDTVPYLDTVILTATPHEGYQFSSWNDGNTDNPRMVVATSDKWYIAMFEFEYIPRTVTLQVADSTPYGIVSGGGVYIDPINVSISATPDYGYHFAYWNDGNTSNPRTIMLTRDTTFIAVFEKNKYQIIGSASAKIDYNFDFENASQDVQWAFQNANYLNRWCIATLEDTNRALFISNNNGISNTYDIGVNSDVFAYAIMTLDTGVYNYSYNWRYRGGGSFSYMHVALLPVSSPLSSYGWEYSWYYPVLPRTIITLDGGYGLGTFSSLWNNKNGQVNIPTPGEYKIVFFWHNNDMTTMNNAAAVDNIQFYNDIPENEILHGYVLGSDTVYHLDTVMLTAVPYEGYRFVKWNDGNTENPRTVIATSDKFFIALFEEAPSIVVADSIVACDSYQWHGNVYTASTMLFDTLPATGAGDSIVAHYLMVNHPAHTAITETACESYVWTHADGSTQTCMVSGNYTYSHIDANGCTQVDTLHLTIYHAANLASSVSACDSYTWTHADGTTQTYTESGDYTYSHEDVHSCMQVDTLHLIINHSTTGEITISACDSFDWHDSTYTESGDYVRTLSNAVGCDSVVTLHLTVNHPAHTAITESACESYVWTHADGTTQTYFVSGDYLYSHSDVNGCVQVDTLHLAIHHPSTSVDEQSACGPFTWINGETYTSSVFGPTYTLSNEAGCDSVVTLSLTMYHSDTTQFTVTACNSFVWGDSTYTETGDYAQTYEGSNGCLSVSIMHLTINYSDTTEESATACDSYLWHGNNYTESGDYTAYYTNTVGCYSMTTLHLTVNHSSVDEITATACENYEWHGIVYTESGDYDYTLTAANGCDSVVTLHLTVNEGVATEFAITTVDSCYIWNGQTYCASGDYTQNFETVDGCDSVVTLHLTITVGVDDYDYSNSLIIYPNPTKDVVNVELTINNEQLEGVGIQVFDVYGRLLEVVNMADARGASLQTAQIDLSQYAKGVYFVKAVSEGKVIAVRKVVKR